MDQNSGFFLLGNEASAGILMGTRSVGCTLCFCSALCSTIQMNVGTGLPCLSIEVIKPVSLSWEG